MNRVPYVDGFYIAEPDDKRVEPTMFYNEATASAWLRSEGGGRLHTFGKVKPIAPPENPSNKSA